MNPLNYFKIGAAVTALVLISAILGFTYRAGQNSVQVKWEVEKVAHANALIAQASRHRKIERQWGEATTLLVESLRGAQEKLQDDYESTIADRDAGALRLRGDLAGCRDKLPTDTTASPGDNGAGDSGLSPERQGVALRTWRDADRVALKLQGAQRYINTVCQSTPASP